MGEIKLRLANGSLIAGSKLPSVRQLSEHFSCSKNTVIKAYTELEKEHLIYSISKSGYYVVNEYQNASNENEVIDFLSAGPDKMLCLILNFNIV